MNTPYLIDTHTHIYYHDRKNLEAHIQRCRSNNIQKVLMPNINTESIKQIQSALETYPDFCIPMMGLHPCSVKENHQAELSIIKQTLDNMKVCAIGEIGIDLHWDTSTLSWQKQVFETQVHWALEKNLPIDIHCRKAFDEIFEILDGIKKTNAKLKGVFHCFTGNTEQAYRAIDLGFLLGIGGIVTYKNAGLDKVVKDIDLKHIILETDAPYLSPVPYRGKPNESSYLIYIAEKIADLKGCTIEEVARITTQNANKIFSLSQ